MNEKKTIDIPVWLLHSWSRHRLKNNNINISHKFDLNLTTSHWIHVDKL